MFSKKNGLGLGKEETENTHNMMRFYDLVDTLGVGQWIDEYAAREESTDDDTDSGPGGERPSGQHH